MFRGSTRQPPPPVRKHGHRFYRNYFENLQKRATRVVAVLGNAAEVVIVLDGPMLVQFMQRQECGSDACLCADVAPSGQNRGKALAIALHHTC